MKRLSIWLVCSLLFTLFACAKPDAKQEVLSAHRMLDSTKGYQYKANFEASTAIDGEDEQPVVSIAVNGNVNQEGAASSGMIKVKGFIGDRNTDAAVPFYTDVRRMYFDPTELLGSLEKIETGKEEVWELTLTDMWPVSFRDAVQAAPEDRFRDEAITKEEKDRGVRRKISIGIEPGEQTPFLSMLPRYLMGDEAPFDTFSIEASIGKSGKLIGYSALGEKENNGSLFIWRADVSYQNIGKSFEIVIPTDKKVVPEDEWKSLFKAMKMP